MTLGRNFITAFHTLYEYPHAEAREHFIAEMQSWYNTVCDIKIRETDLPILNQQIYDWFLTAGASIENFIYNKNEIMCYDEFAVVLLYTKNLRQSLDKYLPR